MTKRVRFSSFFIRASSFCIFFFFFFFFFKKKKKIFFMFLWLLNHLPALSPESLAAWAKITPRAALAAGMSFAVAVLLGPRWIAWLRRHFREPIKSDSPEIVRLHRDKQSTPTMGGLFVLAALLARFCCSAICATAMWRRRCSWRSA